MLDQNAAAHVRDLLQPGDFYEERHGHVFRAAVALSDRGEPIDIVTLRNELERNGTLARSGGVDYISELSTVTPAATSVRHYAAIVVEHALRRRLIAAGQEIAESGFDDRLSGEAATELAEQRVFRIATTRTVTDASPLGPLLRDTWAQLEQKLGRQSFITGVPTNFPSLDRMTSGLQPGELVILAARPSVGKTACAVQIARNAAVLAEQGVAVFSLEMSKEALVQRLLCSESRVDSFQLRTGQADAATFQRIARAMDTLTRAPLWIDDTPGLTISALRSRARRMRAQSKVQLIVVDYLQLMHGGGGGGRSESRVQEVSEISAGLKAIAKEIEVPVLALSQLSRESERRADRRPQLSDLRDSGTIEADADVVLFLYREGMHNPEVDRSQTTLIVAKNRNGPVGDVDGMVFHAGTTSFSEPSTPRHGG